MADVRIGISGWRYRRWLGPEGAAAIERPPGATGESLRMSWPAFGRAAAGSAAVRGGRN